MTTIDARGNNGRALSTQLQKRGITAAQWHTLAKNLYPGARIESVLMLIDYCHARRLDPLKKPAHIVQMLVKDAATGKESYRDVILPGIYELRTTAHRTREYLGHSAPEYGPIIKFAGVEAPEWCEMTMKRLIGKQIAEFPVRVYFREVLGTKKDGKQNFDGDPSLLQGRKQIVSKYICQRATHLTQLARAKERAEIRACEDGGGMGMETRLKCAQSSGHSDIWFSKCVPSVPGGAASVAAPNTRATPP
jgi:RecT family